MVRDYITWNVVKLDCVYVVHRCGPGGSKRACHAAGPGSIPGRDKFPGWGFSGFSSPIKQMPGTFRPPRSLNIIWPSLSSSIIIHHGHEWPEMLTRPKASNIHIRESSTQWDQGSMPYKKFDYNIYITLIWWHYDTFETQRLISRSLVYVEWRKNSFSWGKVIRSVPL